MIFGEKADSTYLCVRERLDECFDIKILESLGPEGADGSGQTWRQCKRKIKVGKDKSVTGKLAPVREPEPAMTLTEEVKECRSAVIGVRGVKVHTGSERADGVRSLAQERRKMAPKEAPCSSMQIPQKTQVGRIPAVTWKLAPKPTPKEQVEKEQPSEQSIAQKSGSAAKTG